MDIIQGAITQVVLVLLLLEGGGKGVQIRVCSSELVVLGCGGV